RLTSSFSVLSFRLFRAARHDGERMDGVLHQVAEGAVDHAMALERAAAAEAPGHDRKPPVRAAALAVAGMAAVLLALVHEVERLRLERGQSLADRLGDAHCLSSTYFARNADCATTKSSIRPMPPKNLNDAQIFSE